MTPQEILQRISADDVVTAVTIGICDDQLLRLEHAVKQRQLTRGRRFRIDQSIKLNASVRPRYLVGATGVVRKVNQKRCVVDFDQGQNLGRFAPGIGITVPFDMLEEV